MDNTGATVHDRWMLPDPEIVDRIIRDVSGREILPRFRNLAAHEISKKNRGEIVTIADEAAEAALSRDLKDLVPGAHFVGEEATAKNPDDLDVLAGSEPVWIIDPVDGTQNFANGDPKFAVIVALCIGGETCAGWIHEPITDTTVWAIKGQGAWEGGARLTIPPAADISQFRGSLNKRVRSRLEDHQARDRIVIPREMTRYRCVGAEYADLARDHLQFARYGGRLKPWDHAAGVLIHTEAGGYNAVSGTQKPYAVTPELKERTLLAAPSNDSWVQLNDLISAYGLSAA